MSSLLLLTTASLVLALASPLQAQSSLPIQPRPEPPTATLVGTVVSSTGTALVVRTDQGPEITLDVDNTSTVPAGLIAGTRVLVRYQVLDGGHLHVVSVDLPRAPPDEP
jgi:hypothetical protein